MMRSGIAAFSLALSVTAVPAAFAGAGVCQGVAAQLAGHYPKCSVTVITPKDLDTSHSARNLVIEKLPGNGTGQGPSLEVTVDLYNAQSKQFLNTAFDIDFAKEGNQTVQTVVHGLNLANTFETVTCQNEAESIKDFQAANARSAGVSWSGNQGSTFVQRTSGHSVQVAIQSDFRLLGAKINLSALEIGSNDTVLLNCSE